MKKVTIALIFLLQKSTQKITKISKRDSIKFVTSKEISSLDLLDIFDISERTPEFWQYYSDYGQIDIEPIQIGNDIAVEIPESEFKIVKFDPSNKIENSYYTLYIEEENKCVIYPILKTKNFEKKIFKNLKKEECSSLKLWPDSGDFAYLTYTGEKNKNKVNFNVNGISSSIPYSGNPKENYQIIREEKSKKFKTIFVYKNSLFKNFDTTITILSQNEELFPNGNFKLFPDDDNIIIIWLNIQLKDINGKLVAFCWVKYKRLSGSISTRFGRLSMIKDRITREQIIKFESDYSLDLLENTLLFAGFDENIEYYYEIFKEDFMLKLCKLPQELDIVDYKSVTKNCNFQPYSNRNFKEGEFITGVEVMKNGQIFIKSQIDGVFDSELLRTSLKGNGISFIDKFPNSEIVIPKSDAMHKLTYRPFKKCLIYSKYEKKTLIWSLSKKEIEEKGFVNIWKDIFLKIYDRETEANITLQVNYKKPDEDLVFAHSSQSQKDFKLYEEEENEWVYYRDKRFECKGPYLEIDNESVKSNQTSIKAKLSHVYPTTKMASLIDLDYITSIKERLEYNEKEKGIPASYCSIQRLLQSELSKITLYCNSDNYLEYLEFINTGRVTIKQPLEDYQIKCYNIVCHSGGSLALIQSDKENFNEGYFLSVRFKKDNEKNILIRKIEGVFLESVFKKQIIYVEKESYSGDQTEKKNYIFGLDKEFKGGKFFFDPFSCFPILKFDEKNEMSYGDEAKIEFYVKNKEEELSQNIVVKVIKNPNKVDMKVKKKILFEDLVKKNNHKISYKISDIFDITGNSFIIDEELRKNTIREKVYLETDENLKIIYPKLNRNQDRNLYQLITFGNDKKFTLVYGDFSEGRSSFFPRIDLFEKDKEIFSHVVQKINVQELSIYKEDDKMPDCAIATGRININGISEFEYYGKVSILYLYAGENYSTIGGLNNCNYKDIELLWKNLPNYERKDSFVGVKRGVIFIINFNCEKEDIDYSKSVTEITPKEHYVRSYSFFDVEFDEVPEDEEYLEKRIVIFPYLDELTDSLKITSVTRKKSKFPTEYLFYKDILNIDSENLNSKLSFYSSFNYVKFRKNLENLDIVIITSENLLLNINSKMKFIPKHLFLKFEDSELKEYKFPLNSEKNICDTTKDFIICSFSRTNIKKREEIEIFLTIWAKIEGKYMGNGNSYRTQKLTTDTPVNSFQVKNYEENTIVYIKESEILETKLENSMNITFRIYDGQYVDYDTLSLNIKSNFWNGENRKLSPADYIENQGEEERHTKIFIISSVLFFIVVLGLFFLAWCFIRGEEKIEDDDRYIEVQNYETSD